MSACEVELDESAGEANGAAYLVHMLLSQQAAGNDPAGFAAAARRLRPVSLYLSDTEEGCAVESTPAGLRVGPATGIAVTSVTAESRHVLEVTQLRITGGILITGPLRGPRLWGVLRDIATRKVIIKGLISHYRNTMRFLTLINVAG